MSDYDITGRNYNYTRKADPYLVRLMRTMLNPKKGSTYLDIGCGTGNYTIALAEDGTKFIGVDPSRVMLQEAKQKTTNITWTLGDAEHIPYNDQMFSGALASLTIHHWSYLNQGFIEVYRTLKPKSNFVIFTATAEQMQNYWLNHYFPEMMKTSTNQMPSLEAIMDAAHNAGFRLSSSVEYFIETDLQDLFLYSGKHNPAMYLDGAVRSNISSFASLSNEMEIAQGLVKLSSDIDSLQFLRVKSAFDEKTGDYLMLEFSKD
jgi:ubiquinone/menaquinone biosynthesis C-methylase UbiE